MQTTMGSVFVLLLLTCVAKVCGTFRHSMSRPTLPDILHRLNLPSTFSADRILFFVVPVQRPGELREAEGSRVVVEAVQVADGDSAAFPGDAGISVERRQEGRNESFTVRSLDEVFRSEEDYPQVAFNLQVPLVLPLDIGFSHDHHSASLQVCSTDSRTWRENVITHIMRSLRLPDPPKWNHGRLRTKVRLIKDIMASRHHGDVHDSEMAIDLLQKLWWCLSLADVLYYDFLEGTVGSGSQYQSIRAEGADTYRLMQSSLALVREAYTHFNAPTSLLDQIDELGSRIASSLSQFST